VSASGVSAGGVSFVLPVYNGERWLDEALRAILAQDDGRPFEVLVVDDRSSDGSAEILGRFAGDPRVRVQPGAGRGAAAAINQGLRAARHPVVCQVDQDVVLGPGWMAALCEALAAPGVGAAQGYYQTPRRGSPWARVMGLDLELRYSRIGGSALDHVCTGNSAYRAEALHRVGLLDESLGYGYDNDLSYRLGRAGYRLAFCREARSVHQWRDGLWPYLRQQYGVGYGRLDLVAKHPGRAGGDDVSGWRMILHVPATLAVLAASTAAALGALAGMPWRPWLLLAAAVAAVLALDRVVAGLEAALRFRDPAGLAFAPIHLLRDLAWTAALLAWSGRRLAGGATRPRQSMRRQPAPAAAAAAHLHGAGQPPDDYDDYDDCGHFDDCDDFLIVVPARNEAASLPRVVAEARDAWPGSEILVVDDASDDSTPALLPGLGVRWLRFGQHLGLGGALRAGMRDARRRGHQAVVRLDADGQHPADQIGRLLAPLRAGLADAVHGSRFAAGTGRRGRGGMRRLGQRLLAGLLSLVTGRAVSDPTSGFWAFGPAAVRVLGEHHPTGYPEPELLLFLRRNGLRVVEAPVTMRDRAAGTTSLTGPRTALAVLRVLLALVVVPLRARVSSSPP
jgi:glycosyltransferase involved in cell wall biosynthesis